MAKPLVTCEPVYLHAITHEGAGNVTEASRRLEVEVTGCMLRASRDCRDRASSKRARSEGVGGRSGRRNRGLD